jgi:hypothetical protein
MFKVNEYYDGRVKSLAFASPAGPATVGVMAPGEYEFATQTPGKKAGRPTARARPSPCRPTRRSSSGWRRTARTFACTNKREPRHGNAGPLKRAPHSPPNRL